MIELDHITKYYASQKAVEDFTLKIGRGQISGIIGPNGSGKTTLLKMIVGLLWPSSGNITICGTKIGPKSIYENKLQIGYFPEEVILYKKLTGKEFLEFVCNLYRTEKCVAAAKEYAQLFGLEDNMAKLIEEYSHGMMRKISLIAALVHDPDILVLDEPTNGLDPRAIKNLKDVLLKKKSENKITVVSTHILDMAEYLCDVVTILEKGKLIFTGSLEDLRRTKDLPHARLEELFLEMTGKESERVQ